MFGTGKCWRRRTASVGTAMPMLFQIKNHTLWPRCWWISISMCTDCETIYTLTIERSLWTTSEGSCSQSSSSNTQLLCCIIHLLTLRGGFVVMLRNRGPGLQDNLDIWLNATVFEYNTSVSSSTGVTHHYTLCLEAKQHYLWIGCSLCLQQRRGQCIIGQGTCLKRGRKLIRVWEKFKGEECRGMLTCTNLWFRTLEPYV